MEYIYDYLRPIVNTIHFFIEFEDEDNKFCINTFDLLNMKAPDPKKVLIIDIKNNDQMLGICAWAQYHGYQFHVTKTNIFHNQDKNNNHFFDACRTKNLSGLKNDEIMYNTVIIGYQLAKYISLENPIIDVYQDDIDLLQEISIRHIKLMTLKDFLKIYQTPKCINMHH
ncbi:hypothetical protein H012_gp783 [Acanthamoeba polyphaga moumouvirus]|uniref:DUF5894 domain-containing protein n=1 Tax=Acanthamoeba polyphaga moumouvirus TaxID=1269028 RepID=L7RBU8_9VIRU|nr:hypothetical protein H012_gp783 [Acanthamoeba polyphaga moumouvirus]AGC01682.1 hypothetical protein Moumou_00138 [Acanthamoeba polyphaga moumouvirus]AQN68020.1 hypothetical protein [Saudi moumouvirus]